MSNPIPMGTFWFIYGLLFLSIFLCRTVPLLALKNRELSPRVTRALEMIPAAAFAALVANDLFEPETFAMGWWDGVFPLIAGAGVVVVARLTHSLLWSAVFGIVAYGLLSLIQIP